MKFNVTLLLLLSSVVSLAQSSVGEAVVSIQSGTWNEPSTWDCTCIPDVQHEVTVMSGHQVEAQAGDTVRAESVAIDNGGILVLPTTSMIEVSSSWASEGTVDGQGWVVFVGEGPHDCGPAVLDRIDLGEGTTQIVDTLVVTSELHISDAELTTNGLLVLEGESGLTSSGGVVTGELTRRFDWDKINPYTHMMGSGVSGSTAESFLGLPGAVYVKSWQETGTSYTTLVEEDELTVGTGYSCALPSGSYAYSISGEPVTEAQIQVTGEAPNSFWRGWNLLCNPLTGFVDLNLATESGPGAQGATYQWVDSLLTYTAQVAGVGTFGSKGILFPGDAFWTIADTTYSLDFTPSCLVPRSTLELQSSSPSSGLLAMEMKNGSSREQCSVGLDGGHASEYDRLEDAMFSSAFRGRNNLDIYTHTSDSIPVMVNATHGDAQVIPVYIKAGNGEELTINMPSVPENFCLALEDIETGLTEGIEPGFSYNFTCNSSSDHHRFNLIVGGTIAAEVTSASCATATNGTVVVSVPDQTSTLTLVDINGEAAGTFVGDPSGGVFADLAEGIYVLTALTEGCMDLTREVEVNSNAAGDVAFEVQAMPDHIGCYDDHGGIALDMDGGQAPYSVEWEHGDTGTSIEVEQAGVFFAVITDAHGCSDSASVEVLEAPQVVAEMDAESTVVALVGGEAEVSFNNISTGATSHQWSFGDGGSSSEMSPTHVYTEPGSYTVGLNAWNDYCSDTYQVVVTVEVVSSIGEAVNAIDPTLQRTSSGWSLNHPQEVFSAEVYDLTGRVVMSMQGAPGVPLIIDAGAMPVVSLIRWYGEQTGRQKTWRVAR